METSKFLRFLSGLTWGFSFLLACAWAQPSIQLTAIGSYQGTGSEISAYDHQSKRLFVTDAENNKVDILDLRNPASPSPISSIDLSAFGLSVTSVTVYNGLVAVASEAQVTQDPGKVVFFDVYGNYLNDVSVGALPDMVTFTPNGNYVLVANEGEPDDDYLVDPEGSISIINLKRGVNRATVSTAGFTAFNGATNLDPSIRFFGPGATRAQDLEPEYITVSQDSRTAYVSCQENNAIAVVDIPSATVTTLLGLGFKDHSLPGNGIDASDRDGIINIKPWPVLGMPQPDAIAYYRSGNKKYLLTANEGDARDYDGFSEEKRIKDLTLDPVVFTPAANLQDDDSIGRLNVTTTLGENGGVFSALYAYGTRSFSIYDDQGQLVFDSGDDLEQITAAAYPADFNTNNDENEFDNRSDNKGPEPEGVVVGKVGSRTYAFICLERIGGVMVYDITFAQAPTFVQYINTRDFTQPVANAGDLGPEGLVFIDRGHSPTNKPLLVVTHEVSFTTTVFEINTVNSNRFALAENPDLFIAYPNPLVDQTTVKFELNEPSPVSVKVFNQVGQEVNILAEQSFEKGLHQLSWKGDDQSGNLLPSGTYYLRLSTNRTLQVRKIVIAR